MLVDQKLYDAAVKLAISRYPKGWAGAAAMYTKDGQILTSVYVDTNNTGADLCMETGCICEAHKLDIPIAASICVSRQTEGEPFVILTPCGICQERLAYWGANVNVAVPCADDSSKWQSKALSEVQPFYWHKVFSPF